MFCIFLASYVYILFEQADIIMCFRPRLFSRLGISHLAGLFYGSTWSYFSRSSYRAFIGFGIILLI